MRRNSSTRGGYRYVDPGSNQGTEISPMVTGHSYEDKKANLSSVIF